MKITTAIFIACGSLELLERYFLPRQPFPFLMLESSHVRKCLFVFVLFFNVKSCSVFCSFYPQILICLVRREKNGMIFIGNSTFKMDNRRESDKITGYKDQEEDKDVCSVFNFLLKLHLVQ